MSTPRETTNQEEQAYDPYGQLGMSEEQMQAQMSGAGQMHDYVRPFFKIHHSNSVDIFILLERNKIET